MDGKPKRRFRTAASALVAVIVLGFLLLYRPIGETGHPDWPYVRQVLLFTEPRGYVGFVRRWNRPARVGAVSPRPERDLPDVRAVLEELNAALAGTGMSLAFDQTNPDVRIFFTETATFRDIDTVHDCEVPADSVGYFCARVSAAGVIDSAIIVVAFDDPVSVNQSVVLEELTQALGPMNDVRDPAFADSLFYERDGDQGAPAYKVLSPRDRQLLRFLYTHLKPGDSEAKVRIAFDRFWLTAHAPEIY